MKHSNRVKPNKKIIRSILFIVLFLILFSIILLITSALPKKRSSLESIGYSFGSNSLESHRRFHLESKEENIYNLGEYRVNISNDKLLIFNLSVKCQDDAFKTLQKNDILVQHSVIESFSMYGNNYLPDTLKGKQKIKQKIKANIYKNLKNAIVKEVYFNKFLIR